MPGFYSVESSDYVYHQRTSVKQCPEMRKGAMGGIYIACRLAESNPARKWLQDCVIFIKFANAGWNPDWNSLYYINIYWIRPYACRPSCESGQI